jgi:predicted nucleic acid-binding protein
MRECTPEFADSTYIRFEKMAPQYYQVWEPISDDFETAAKFMRRYETGLRAGDALHLAIAYNRGAQDMLTLDIGLAHAANILGIPVSLGV